MFQLNIKTIKDGVLHFPKKFNGFTVRLPDYVTNIQVVRVVPKNRHIVIEVVYRVEVADEQPDNGFYAGIDLGYPNLFKIPTILLKSA